MSTLNPHKPNKSRISTHEGGTGRKAGAEEELAVMSLSSFLQDTFYEKSSEPLVRMFDLVKKTDPEFVLKLAAAARQEFNLRTVPAALMGMWTLLYGQPPTHFARKVFTRGDELGDYFGAVSALSDNKKVTPAAVRFGRKILQTSLTERQALRYRNANRHWSLAKMIRLTHARSGGISGEKMALFNFILDWQLVGSLEQAWSATDNYAKTHLPLIEKAVSGEDSGAVSWERARSRGDSWNEVVEDMGYMALLRNLNNFFEDDTFDKWDHVVDTLQDPEAVSRSKQLPFRYFAALKAIGDVGDVWYYYGRSVDRSSHKMYHRVAHAVETAMDRSVGNLPPLEGRTAIIVDTSGSMTFSTVSGNSTMTYLDIAAVFGAALASSYGATLVEFATDAKKTEIKKDTSVAYIAKNILRDSGSIGHGTNLRAAFRIANPEDYDNIVVFSDMAIADIVSHSLGNYRGRVFSVNLASYEAQMERVGSEFYAIGGWSDATLKIISTLTNTNIVDYIKDYNG